MGAEEHSSSAVAEEDAKKKARGSRTKKRARRGSKKKKARRSSKEKGDKKEKKDKKEGGKKKGKKKKDEGPCPYPLWQPKYKKGTAPEDGPECLPHGWKAAEDEMSGKLYYWRLDDAEG